MSSQSTPLNTASQMTINTDLSKIFVGDNRYKSALFTNGGGSPVTIPEGQLLGKINASGKVAVLASASSDGSQFPEGINVGERTVAAGATVTLWYCVAGEVAAEKVVLNGSDTMATVVSGRTIRERIGSDTVGINLVTSTEMTGYDN